MSDPLSLLRQATIAGRSVTSEDGYYTFGSIRLPEKTSTCFRRSIKGNDYCYTLKDIVLFLANAELGDVEYRKKVVQEGGGVTFVVAYDKQALKDYLSGAIDSCPQIDLQLASSYQLPAEAIATSGHADSQIMSAERMQEQRERYAAQMERTMQKTKSGAGAEASETIGTLRELKRKSAVAFDGDGEDEAIDRQFLEADRKLLEKLRADEIPAHTRSTVLNAPNTDFSIVLKLFTEKVLKPMQAPASKGAPAPAPARQPAAPARPTAPMDSTRAPAAPSSASAAASSAAPPSSSTGPYRKIPTIIVPSAPTACINMYNYEDLLVRGTYISVEEKRKANAHRAREAMMQRILPNGAVVMYRVIDDPTKLKEQEWDYVVAVLATGQDWQFKGWKYPTPVTLFQNVLGVHFCLDSAAVDANIQSWNCKVLKVNMFKQHLNASTAREFWMYVDDHQKIVRAARAAKAAAAPAAKPAGHAAQHASSSRAAAPAPPAPAAAAPHRSSAPAPAPAPLPPQAPMQPRPMGAVPPPPPPQFRAPPPVPEMTK